jgi:hypothetical protein
MRHKTLLHLVCLFGSLLLCGTTARADKAFADGDDGYGIAKNPTGASTALFASTYVNTNMGRRYNDEGFLATTSRKNGEDSTSFIENGAGNILAAPGTTLNKYFVGGPFTDILGKNGLAKPTVAPKDPNGVGLVRNGLHSRTGPYSSSASNDNESIYSFARKTAVSKTTGAAGAIAYDPFTLNSGGRTTYDPTLNGSLQLDTSRDSGEIAFLATDSFVDPTLGSLIASGPQPMNQTLWTLDISANGPISSVSNLTINFNLNPLAFQELSIPGYTSSMALAFDTSVDNALESRTGPISVVDGTAMLSDFAPFSSTTFTPLYGMGEQIADGNQSSVSLVPLPRGAVMGLSLLVAIWGASGVFHK